MPLWRRGKVFGALGGGQECDSEFLWPANDRGVAKEFSAEAAKGVIGVGNVLGVRGVRGP